MTIEEVYKGIDKVILDVLMYNDDLMKISQSLSFNGFKRFFRYSTKKLLKEHLYLENSMFDKYRKILNVDVKSEKVSANSIKEVLYIAKIKLERAITELGNLNKEHFNLVGFENDVAQCVLKLFLHDYEKMCRYCYQLDTTNDVNYMRIVDMKLHEKYKKMEEEHD